MIQFVHRGLCGKYSAYLRDSVKAINRLRYAVLTEQAKTDNTHKVGIDKSGTVISEADLDHMLAQPKLTIFFGDSNGLPADILASCDEVYRISLLPIPHQFEATIITEQIAKALVK